MGVTGYKQHSCHWDSALGDHSPQMQATSRYARASSNEESVDLQTIGAVAHVGPARGWDYMANIIK